MNNRILCTLLLVTSTFTLAQQKATDDLFAAIKDADIQAVEKALARGADINAVERATQNTPLMEALEQYVESFIQRKEKTKTSDIIAALFGSASALGAVAAADRQFQLRHNRDGVPLAICIAVSAGFLCGAAIYWASKKLLFYNTQHKQNRLTPIIKKLSQHPRLILDQPHSITRQTTIDMVHNMLNPQRYISAACYVMRLGEVNNEGSHPMVILNVNGNNYPILEKDFNQDFKPFLIELTITLGESVKTLKRSFTQRIPFEITTQEEIL